LIRRLLESDSDIGKVVTKFQNQSFTLGTDETNLHGGGETHLVELLRTVQPELYGIDRIVVWSGKATLKALKVRTYLSKRNPLALDKGLLQRTLWQRYCLSQTAYDKG
jgi:hypothetical protein